MIDVWMAALSIDWETVNIEVGDLVTKRAIFGVHKCFC